MGGDCDLYIDLPLDFNLLEDSPFANMAGEQAGCASLYLNLRAWWQAAKACLNENL